MNTKKSASVRLPTEHLIKQPYGSLSKIQISSMIKNGFELGDVRAMFSCSELYSSTNALQRICYPPTQKTQRLLTAKSSSRLSPQESAIAFQFAKVLEHSTIVFGSQELAETWLSQTCKNLEDLIPLDIIDNSIGFQLVEDYLDSVILDIY